MQGGTLVNRDQFIRNSLLTTKIFLNAAGFLRISQDSELPKPSKNRHNEDSDSPDPLDSTRIHPEDYELARKMATDALELDEEDIHDEHPSHVVSLIMRDPDNEKKLDELNLDDFAVNMYETNQDKKRHTLNVIRAELLSPFGEQRKDFERPDEWEVLTMLTGETTRTLRIGIIVSAQVIRTAKDVTFVRLDSGVEGTISQQYLADSNEVPKRGQTIPAVIIHVKDNPLTDPHPVELSSRHAEVSVGDSQFRRVKADDFWNHVQHDRDNDMQARKKRAEVDKTRRVIKHPNFHNFNAAQAEAYLDKQQRGDVVIRPSSKGANHLAVTWKVEDKLYQHIDVTDANADLSGQTVGNRLIIDEAHQYSDLDELIVNHVQTMNRKVEELMMHEKFKPGPEEELREYNYLTINCATADSQRFARSVPEELCGGKSLEECVWLLAEQKATWPLQLVLPCQQELDCANLGTLSSQVLYLRSRSADWLILPSLCASPQKHTISSKLRRQASLSYVMPSKSGAYTFRSLVVPAY